MGGRRVVLVGLILALAAAGADLLLLRSFEFIPAPDFPAPYAPSEALRLAATPAPDLAPQPATPTAEGATIVIVDGLRVDASRKMRTLERLRERGTDATVRVDFPSFSRVGYAGILTGASPRVH